MPARKSTFDAERFLPLRPELLFILLVLAQRARHGYALLEAVALESEGEVRLRIGSLYRLLGRLLDDGLIEEVGPPAHERSGDERRRYYGITRTGRAVLSAEVERMKRVLALAEPARIGRRAGRA
jgi:DNA-binding PadR family transcriptional regulator